MKRGTSALAPPTPLCYAGAGPDSASLHRGRPGPCLLAAPRDSNPDSLTGSVALNALPYSTSPSGPSVHLQSLSVIAHGSNGIIHALCGAYLLPQAFPFKLRGHFILSVAKDPAKVRTP